MYPEGMHDDDRNVDFSIPLVPVEGPVRRKPGQRLFPYLLVACAILLSLSVVWLFAAKLSSILDSRNVKVTVAAHRDSATERAEAVAVFGSFDAIQERQLPSSTSERQRREAIAALFSQLEKCTAGGDVDGFRTLVDFERLLKRIELTGGIRGWTSLEKKYLRTELKTSVDIEPYWGKIVVAGLVTPTDDPNSRIAYAYGWSQRSEEQVEYRFWIGRAGDSWKLYDWERLDLGLSTSQEWGLYCKYNQSPKMDGFRRWSDLVVEADALTAKGQYETAKEKLRLAESQLVPPEVEDYCWLLTGHRWGALSDYADMQRCYANVKRPDDTPGVYFGLMGSKRWSNPSEALKHAQSYEAATGPSPELLKVKAQLLTRLNRKDEAVEQWKRLLRIQPDDSQALTELYLALPDDDKSAFESQLARLEDPAKAAVGIATSVGYRDFRGLLFLVEYLEREASGSPGAAYVKGLASYLDGRYPEAAQSYRRAFESEADQDTRGSYVNAYLEAMIAEGEVVAALKTVPDQKSALEWLFYSNDEGDISLTKEEYRQLVAWYSAHFPDELDAVQRQADLDIDEQRFEEAERLLRHALAKVPADERDDTDGDDEFNEKESYRDSFARSLARVLREQGRLREAYESGADRRERFSQLARQAVDDRRWNDARWLLDVHRARDPDDAAIHSIEGELAAHEKRWNDAIRQFQLAIGADPEGDNWLVQRRFLDVCVESGKWKTYYLYHDDRAEAFDSLASRLASDKNWDVLNELIAEHESRSRNDSNLTKYKAEIAWEREQYATYAELADQLMQSNDGDVISVFEREHIENRRLSALLRGRAFDRAMELARTKQRKENDATLLAIVNAATGNLAEAKRLAREAATVRESATTFYTHDDVGHIFLGDQFSDLHREFPVELPYASAQTLAVFVLDGPRPLEATDIAATLRQLGIHTTVTAQALESSDSNVTSAFALQFDQASIWLVTGEGRFDDGWEPVDEAVPLADRVENCRAWLAVGTAAWTQSGGKQVEVPARRLSGQLADGHATAICAPSHYGWTAFTAYPPRLDLIHAWQSSGDLTPFQDAGISLQSTGSSDDVAAGRQFDRSLREAVRAFESSEGARLEVWACLSRDPAVDLLRLNVTTARRTYGSLEFDGTLQTSSLLIPRLKAGLPMRLHEYEVRAWRLNDQTPVYRP